MSSRTPQQERAFKTRQTILTAARKLVQTLGIERLSLDRVCREAGVSKGALMYHFPNKNALVEGMIADYAEHLRAISADMKRKRLRLLSRGRTRAC